MESDEIFEAEASLEGDEAPQGGIDRINVNDSGVRATIAGNGDYNKHIVSVTTEESPLLPNEPGSGSESGENGEDAAANMSGATDFEGMPWWRTPSVGLHVHTGPLHTLTLPCRYSGCCLLISSSPLLSEE